MSEIIKTPWGNIEWSEVLFGCNKCEWQGPTSECGTKEVRYGKYGLDREKVCPKCQSDIFILNNPKA